MAILSAGVRVNEFDLSEYAVELGLTRPCFVGGATKGALNTPLVINNEEEMYQTFGPKMLTDYGLQAAAVYLRKGNRLTYLRVATAAAKKAKVAVSGPSTGTPAVKAAGSVSFTAATNPADAESVTLHDVVPWLALENDANGALGNVAIVTSAPTRITVAGMSGGDTTHRATGSVKAKGSALPLDADTITISDGTTAVVFEFDDDSTVTPGNVAVDITGLTDAYACWAALHAAITAHAFNVSSVNYAATKAYTFEFDNNGTYTPGNIPVLIGATAAATLANLIAAVNASAVAITGSDGTVTVPQMNLAADVGGLDANAILLKSAANIALVGMAGGADAVPGATVVLMTVWAKSEGSWGDDVYVVLSATTAIGAPAANFDVVVYAPIDKTGVAQPVERFSNLSLDVTSARYIEKVMEEGIVGETNPSDYVEIDVAVNGTPTPGTYQLGAVLADQGDDGVSGLAPADYIGTVSGNTATGLQALRNAERVEFNVLAVPGVSNNLVIAELQAVAEHRADCVWLPDPPLGLTKAQIISWHNGALSGYPNAPTSALDSSYGALHWSWVKDYDEWNKQTLWLPPSGFVAAQMAYTDRIAAPWFPIAGFNRGGIDGRDVEYSPSQEDRNELCPIFTGDNRVNPIVNFVDGGLTIFGNRTLQRKWSMLTDLHVRRCMIHAEKLCATAVKYLVFEPNDPNTWKKFQTVCNKILTDIAAARGFEKILVKCDASTNPAALRNTRRMKGKLFVTPMGAAEGIELDFAITASGAEFSEAA